MEKPKNRFKEMIINSLYYNKSHSISELSLLIGKSIPSTTKVLNELVQSQLIIEAGYAPSTGGRRQARYIINTEINRYMLAVAMDQHYVSAVLYNLANIEITPVIQRKNDPENTFEHLVEVIKEVISHRPEAKDHILGIGISMPGFVDNTLGINSSYEEGDSKLYNIEKEIEDIFEIPTYIENDSTAIAIAEQKFGKARDVSHALIINISWGVGLGIIVDNKLFRGYSGYAGEFSHIPLSDSNLLCSCGKRGCLEVEASLAAALRYAEERLLQGEKSKLAEYLDNDQLEDSASLIRAALNGDQLAISALSKSGYMLGKGIATLIHIMNPEKIILSGQGAEAGQFLMPQIQSAINEFCIPRISQKTSLEISELGSTAQRVGSACVVLEYSLSKLVNNN
ncbi:ROK family protein [Sphingobacterium sp. MYb382]|uniref:ROK family protein n=1 Tax=Sphingobacterium sp. MYb382 TaxID=2745278 RepID=UPI00309E6B96